MLGDRLTELRNRSGYTQEHMAGLLHLKRQAYGAYERNVSYPSPETIVFLADYFNVSTDYLFGRTDNPTPPNKEYTERDELDYELARLSQEKRNKAKAFIRFLKTDEEYSSELLTPSLLQNTVPKPI